MGETSDDVCGACGFPVDVHDHVHLAVVCYPRQLELASEEIAELHREGGPMTELSDEQKRLITQVQSEVLAVTLRDERQSHTATRARLAEVEDERDRLRHLIDGVCLCDGCRARYAEVTGEEHRAAETERLRQSIAAFGDALARLARAEELLRRTAHGGSIVSSAALTPEHIAIARAADRMLVTPDHNAEEALRWMTVASRLTEERDEATRRAEEAEHDARAWQESHRLASATGEAYRVMLVARQPCDVCNHLGCAVCSCCGRDCYLVGRIAAASAVVDAARRVHSREDESVEGPGDGDAPTHAHERRATWDADNGERAGTECRWCRAWLDLGEALAALDGAA